MASEDASCGICQFFTEPSSRLKMISKGSAEGVCRRFPPNSVYPSERAMQPEVSKMDWCGEYRAK